jgi:hypothetical protein
MHGRRSRTCEKRERVEDEEMAEYGVEEWSEEDKDGVRGRNTLRLFGLLP